jgi:ATP-dependent Lon protease
MFKIWYPIFLTLSEAKTREILLKEINMLPEIISKMAKTGWEAYDYLQQNLTERLGKTGKSAEAFKFEDLDQDMFKAWIDIYKEEIKQFLSIPQMGITSLYQERINQVMSKFNLLQSAIAEFSHMLSMNMEESFRIMQDSMDKSKEEGKQPKDLKEYYLIWLKILENNNKDLLKSPQYTEIMNKTLVAMEDFLKARQDALQDVLQTIPVATKKEMDQLSKQIYLLNKQVKELTKKVNNF